jgi:alkylation response protein AidB-like acyl-CoA dehydrogenase
VQLILVDLSMTPPSIDRTWWHLRGMHRSESHLVRWQDAQIATDALIGAPGNYEREPWFSAGALRFVAVQAGGIAAILDQVRDHLVSRGRAGDPHQIARVARLFGFADQAAALCRCRAETWFMDSVDDLIAHIASVRSMISELAEQSISIAQQSVGVSSLFDSHPLSRTMTDLMVYLRQPAPDAQVAIVGRAAARGLDISL